MTGDAVVVAELREQPEGSRQPLLAVQPYLLDGSRGFGALRQRLVGHAQRGLPELLTDAGDEIGACGHALISLT